MTKGTPEPRPSGREISLGSFPGEDVTIKINDAADNLKTALDVEDINSILRFGAEPLMQLSETCEVLAMFAQDNDLIARTGAELTEKGTPENAIQSQLEDTMTSIQALKTARENAITSLDLYIAACTKVLSAMPEAHENYDVVEGQLNNLIDAQKQQKNSSNILEGLEDTLKAAQQRVLKLQQKKPLKSLKPF